MGAGSRRWIASELLVNAPEFTSPEAAEAAFYNAFERADLGAMMNVWADHESIVCIHPMGPRLLGRQAVENSWRGILASGPSMRFHITGLHAIRHDLVAVHCVRENISHGAQFSQQSVMIATNLYQLTDRGWRMILHHASPQLTRLSGPPEPPARLH
jgi:ketosteroid isomerase-like protein